MGLFYFKLIYKIVMPQLWTAPLREEKLIKLVSLKTDFWAFLANIYDMKHEHEKYC